MAMSLCSMSSTNGAEQRSRCREAIIPTSYELEHAPRELSIVGSKSDA